MFGAAILFSNVYHVGPQEEGVVRRFGAYVRTQTPGLTAKIPFFETVNLVPVTDVKRLELGFRTVSPGPPAKYIDAKAESLMLTGDENIVDADLVVQYRIKDSRAYVFHVKDVNSTLRKAAEAAIRQEIGDRGIDEVMTTEKAAIEQAIQAKLQNLVDKYRMGIQITTARFQDVQAPEQVAQAFKDVAAAKEDMRRVVNEAQSYANQMIPAAEGDADKLIREAEAYTKQRVASAQGNVERFSQILQAYKRSPEVTKERLYLEALESILPKLKGVPVVEDEKGTVKVLPLKPSNALPLPISPPPSPKPSDDGGM